MFGWLCIFLPDRWVHIRGGIWQCTRCKTISVGRDPEAASLPPPA